MPITTEIRLTIIDDLREYFGDEIGPKVAHDLIAYDKEITEISRIELRKDRRYVVRYLDTWHSTRTFVTTVF